MRKFILFAFFCIHLLGSWANKNDTILSVSFINDSLTISRAYVFYPDKTADSVVSTGTDPTFTSMRTEYECLNDFSLTIEDISISNTDSVLYLKGFIEIEGLKDDYYPEKNIEIFTGSDFHIKTGTIHRILNDFEPIGTYPIYVLNNWTHNYTSYKRGDDPEVQTFECEIKLKPKARYLIFAKYPYKVQAFELKELLDNFCNKEDVE